MEIRITYKGINKEGIRGVWCGFKPDDVTVTEEIPILYPAENKELKNINTGKLSTAVVLREGDSQDNYEEVDVSVEEEFEKVLD